MKVPKWIERNLEEHGNCYVKTSAIGGIVFFVNNLEKELGYKIQYRETTDNEGYILEKVKNNG